MNDRRTPPPLSAVAAPARPLRRSPGPAAAGAALAAARRAARPRGDVLRRRRAGGDLAAERDRRARVDPRRAPPPRFPLPLSGRP